MNNNTDLKDNSCLVTGADSGLGLAVAKRFALQECHTILLCRNKEKGENAVHEIKKETPNASVELIICDLASIKSIQDSLGRFKEKHLGPPAGLKIYFPQQ